MSNAQSIEDRKQEIAFKAELEKKVNARQKAIESEVVTDVLIKEARGGGDRVFIVNQLPKTLLFRAEREMVPMGEKQYLQPTGEVIDELLPGIHISQTGDGGYLFFAGQQESKQRLETVDNYIKSNWPSSKPLPVREFYCYQPGNMLSPPRPLSMVLRVELQTSPPVESNSTVSGSPSTISPTMLAAIKTQVKEELLAEQKKVKAAQLVKARAAKKSNNK